MLTPTEVAELRWTVVWFGDCIDAPDPDAWHPEEPRKGGTESQEAYEARRAQYERTAKDLCADCPVRVECLRLALDEEYDLPRSWIHGVRGGKAPWQRYQMRRTIRRNARKAVA